MSLRILPLLLLALACHAADAVGDFSSAMADNDMQRKKAAISALLALPASNDDQVLPLLSGAIADRQAGAAAAAALGQRLGSTPRGASLNAGADPAKVQAAWQSAIAQRLQALEVEKMKKAAAEKDKAAKEKADKEKAGKTSGKTNEEVAAPAERPTRAPAEDLGRLYRVVFSSGGSLVCYVQSRRTDADGNLISIRVVHSDGSGEETISADQISRIEDNGR